MRWSFGCRDGKRPVAERVKANKDLLQAASLVAYFLQNGQAEVFNSAWRDAIGRGKAWKNRAEQGRKALLRIAPELADEVLWSVTLRCYIRSKRSYRG